MSYSYTLWLESNITEMYSLQLVSPKNTSFFKAMTQAADQDSRYLRHLLIQLSKRLTNFALQILIRGSRMAQRALHTHARWQKGRTDVVSVSYIAQNSRRGLHHHISFFCICRYHYWLLYRLPEFPDPESPPGNQLIAPVGKLETWLG